jgi:hypothetical protein
MSLPPPSDTYIGEPRYPAPWTTKKPREGLRDNDAARIVSLAPDVCKSPTVPVPYPIVDFCGHDENYTPSVRFTSQKAMVLRSNTTHVHGDEPGVGKGIKSGTVGDISEPIGHAPQVRAEGSPVIRHLDRFWMNKRNTVGEAIFVRDTKTYEAPRDDDPVPGSLRHEDGIWDEPVRLAFDTTTPEGQKLFEEFMKRRAAEQARRGIYGQAARTVVTNPAAAATATAAAPTVLLPPAIGAIGISRGQAIVEDAARAQLGLEPKLRTPFLRLPVEIETRSVPLNSNVRVSETQGCPIGPYSAMQPICARGGMQAHHVVPDRTFRTGNSSSARLPGPSKSTGLAVCVEPNVAGPDSEHSRIHNRYYDPTANWESMNGSKPGYIRLSRAEDLGAQALELGTRGRCSKEYIRQALRKYHQKVYGLEPDSWVRGQKPPLSPSQINSPGNQGGIISR